MQPSGLSKSMAIQSHLLPSITYIVLVQLVDVHVHVVLQQNKVESHYTTGREKLSSEYSYAILENSENAHEVSENSSHDHCHPLTVL